MNRATRVGVDIGGTFTDIVLVTDDGINVLKTPSTPASPENGVSNGMETAVLDYELTPSSISFLAHGTTVATNAVLEKSWADTALITNEGFRDALEIGRQNRPDLYDFQVEKPAPVIPRDKRFEVSGRLDERGDVDVPLDESEVGDVVDQLRNKDIESVAVCLLFSFENSQHERAVERIIEEETELYTSISSRVLPEIKEYERSVATGLNAALKPRLDRYIGRLESDLSDLGVSVSLKIMQSNGGIITSGAAQERPINTLLSGPAAGVQGAAFVGRQVGMKNIVTMDMGGTSCDVSVVQDGDPMMSNEVTVGDYPVSLPMIDIHTIGAGGGSIGWIDTGGALRVGPRSAGADPGPICYGRGGEDPTITDAHFLLGRIDPSRFGHEFDSLPTSEVVAGMERLGSELGMDEDAVAQGMLDVANASMERALRVVTVERGLDPREFGLVAFGGAGPLHAGRLADNLDIPSVIIPRTAGVLSALGLLISDIVYDYSTTRIRSWDDLDPHELIEEFEGFENQSGTQLEEEGVEPANRVFERAVDVRYAGQSFELTVPVTGDVDSSTLSEIATEFHSLHQQRYGHASPEEPLELVTIRLRARGKIEPPSLPTIPTSATVDSAVRTERSVLFDGQEIETRVLVREQLPGNTSITGPVIIEGTESTIVIYPEQEAHIDEYGTIVVET